MRPAIQQIRARTRGMLGSPNAAARLATRYTAIVLPILLVLIYLNFPVYVYTRDSSWLPKYFYFGLLAVLAPLLAANLKRVVMYMTSPFAFFVAVLLAVNLIHLIGANEDMDLGRSALIGTRIQYFMMAAALGFVFFITPVKLYERVFPFLSVLVSSLVLFDFFMPGVMYEIGTSGSVIGRAAATYINPTIAGEVVLLTFLLASPAVSQKSRMMLFLLAGVAVVVTFTRSSIVAWILLWAFLVMKRVLPRRESFMVLLVLGLLVMFGSFGSYLNNRHDFSSGIDNIEERLDFFSSGHIGDDSAKERGTVLKSGLELFIDNPLTGAGAGATEIGHTGTWPHSVSTHNQFVQLAAEYGVIGIGLWLALAILLWKGRYFADDGHRLAMFFLFVFMSAFTHNMLDFPYWMVTFALVSGKR